MNCEPATEATYVASANVSPDSVRVAVGAVTQMQVVLRDLRGRVIPGAHPSWTSRNPIVAAVDSTGLVSGLSSGVTFVTAGSGTNYDSARVTVLGPPASLTVTPSIAELFPDSNTQLRTLVNDGAGNPLDSVSVTWTSTDTPIASVTSTGLVTGAGLGTAWVRANVGQLTDSAMVSVAVLYTSITTGLAHTCGVTTAGEAYCWGRGDAGDLGVGSDSDRNTPVRVKGGFKFLTLTAGNDHACGVTSTGSGLCWGSNFLGQLGSGDSVDHATPVPIGGVPAFQSLSAGGSFTCGVSVTGDGYCWGSLTGSDAVGASRIPVLVSGSLHFQSIDAGQYHACGLVDSGEAYCWGSDFEGQLGDSAAAFESRTPVLVHGGLKFASVIAGFTHSCGIPLAGSAYCWGNNSYGQLGIGPYTGPTSVPAPVFGGIVFESVNANGDNTCGLSGGITFCWGDNTHGQIGDSTTDRRGMPQGVYGPLVLRQVSEVGLHACGVAPTGRAYCWGYNSSGQLGDGSTVDRHVPTIITYQR